MTHEEFEDLNRKFDAGVKAGVRRALEEHVRAGQPIVVMRDEKIVWLPPEEVRQLLEEEDQR